TDEKTFTIREKIGNIEQKLPKHQFCRCHRSYIVNLSKIEQLSKGKIQLKDKTLIPMTKTREKEVSDAFTSFVQS
ncbi:MAG: LytTR family transcriptional regulator, partial [Turicibacter sp.]|nr:LytTR family transcriptional regulator [Turicibacter sp.]